MSFWNSLRIGASALSAQRLRLDVIANNIANAETTRTESGKPYQREEVVFASQDSNSFMPRLLAAQLAGLPEAQQAVLPAAYRKSGNGPDLGSAGVRVAAIVKDTTEGQRVYDPTHPDADQNGYVTYPNVNLVVEMTNMLSATRSYEANLATVDAAKRMALRALEIGK